MVRDRELEKLRKEIASEKVKVRRASILSKGIDEKKKLKRQLIELQNPRKFIFGRRIGRGFKILAKKTGRGLLKQARLIKERQLKEARESKKSKKKSRGGDFDIFTPIDF